MIAIHRYTRRIGAACSLALAAATALAGGTVGTSFPADFPVFNDASLGKPVIGFGDAGPVARVPVIFLHGNDATPYPTGCERVRTNVQAMAQHFANNGYATSELWALGYQGDQCDLVDQPANSTSSAHTNTANVTDLRKFVKAVMAYTGASKVDIVAHGLGVTLAREYARQDSGASRIRRFVAIDGPNGGIEMCSPSPANSWQLAFNGGYTPDSALCQELGSPDTAFLSRLRKTDKAIRSRDTLVIRNGDSSYPYMPWSDGLVSGAPAMDLWGNPVDFTGSASIPGASEMTLTGQNVYDTSLYAAHVGIANSPVTWQAALSFLMR